MVRSVCAFALPALLVAGCDDGPVGVDVPVETAWTQVTAGHEHVCALTAEGRAACWGSNGVGQLGYRGVSHANQPRYVATELTFSALDAGADHTCGVTTGGDVYCWGGNGFGQLGPGEVGPGWSLPRKVDGVPPARVVSAGGWFTCVVSVAGSASCWGRNHAGQTGRGTTSEFTGPALVDGPHSWSTVSAGTAHACGVTRNARLMCWGEGRSGRLGQGSTASTSRPAEVQGGRSWRAVSAGLDQTCGLSLDGTAFCWGSNVGGGLGDASASDQAIPSRLAGTMRFTGISAAAGPWGCGVTTAAAVACWGTREEGVGFAPTLPDRLQLPTLIGVEGAGGVATGSSRLCALRPGQTIQCVPT